MDTLALACSLLALLMATGALWKVRQVQKAHEEQMAASLAALLDEWEDENRRFVEELERLQRQWMQEMARTASPSAAPSGSTSANEPEPPLTEARVEHPTTSTFQQLLQEVLDMKKAGKTEAEIARQMNRGVGEIQFILQSAAFQKKNQT